MMDFGWYLYQDPLLRYWTTKILEKFPIENAIEIHCQNYGCFLFKIGTAFPIIVPIDLNKEMFRKIFLFYDGF